jgi:hypothetical protein
MEEFIDVCRTLWNSVEPDAMLWDHTTGMVGEPAKVHDVEHTGRFFKVSGPLTPRPARRGCRCCCRPAVRLAAFAPAPMSPTWLSVPTCR